MPDIQLIEVVLASQDGFSAFVDVLSPHAPFSLHILGGILNSRERTGKLEVCDSPGVTAWTSKPLTTIDSSSDLFSVLIFSSLTHQFHFFCSAESLTGPPTKDAEAHVLGTIRAVLRLAYIQAPRYDSVLRLGGDTDAPTERMGDEPPMIIIAAVHEKWTSCLRPLAVAQYASVRYVLPPGHSKDTSNLSHEWTLSTLQESDIDAVRSTSHIPRPKEYFLSRSAYTVCIRKKGEESASQKPIAWALMHADGSIGALYVNAEYRGKGLAQVVVKELTKKLDFTEGVGASSVDDDIGGGALGWNWTDVDLLNEKAMAFFDSVGSWERGWLSHWTYMNVGSDTGLLNSFGDSRQC
ncbi:hypothetical protein BV22DRAFT_1106012 [Leucogyrophana mollusca]|uniref:Uncharacterized protein n=1 Tax=Leucogyrophana mollusca TaxID=85980 RepID=A0ACB8BCT9_9AGAM|nr:hypothetical protein BV22DRAFT_1106012 [Leucogyrophana mollusca]